MVCDTLSKNANVQAAKILHEFLVARVKWRMIWNLNNLWMLQKKMMRRNKKNTSLTTINLSYNNIGPAEAKAIAKALEENESLTELYLSNNQIGPEGALALAEALEINKAEVEQEDLNPSGV